MMLEAVWFKNGKEVYKVDPVVNVVCYDNMEINEIEISNGYDWYSYNDADDFVIRIKNDEK